jgi:hypothetical protein
MTTQTIDAMYDSAEAVLLGFWQPPADTDEDALQVEYIAVPKEAKDRQCAAAAYVPRCSIRELLKRERQHDAERFLDLAVITARRKGARPSFEPPEPADSYAAENDPLRNLNLLCVLCLMVLDGYEPHLHEIGEPVEIGEGEPPLMLRREELVRWGPAVGRMRSVELAEIIGLDSREMARALESVGAGPEQHRFRPKRGLPTITTGYKRDQFRAALAWLVRLP